jgi:hypothetical protein
MVKEKMQSAIYNSVVIMSGSEGIGKERLVPSHVPIFSEDDETDAEDEATDDWVSSDSESDESATQSDIDFIDDDDDDEEYLPPCCICSNQ